MTHYHLVGPGRRARAWLLLRRTVWEFFDDDCPHLAASVAYYALFSVFPLLLGIVAVFGSLLGPDEIESRLVEVLALMLPTTPEQIAAAVRHLGAPREALGFFSIVGLVLSGAAVFSAIRIAIERAWDVEESRPYWRQKWLELTMMVVIVTLMLVSMSFTAAIHLAEEAALLADGPTPLGATTTQLLLWTFAFVSNLAIFSLIYRYVPSVPVAWGDVMPGAVIAALLFEAAKNLFAWYLTTVADYTFVYGPLAMLVSVLVWAYASAVILLVGAEFASEHSRLLSARPARAIAPPPTAAPEG